MLVRSLWSGRTVEDVDCRNGSLIFDRNVDYRDEIGSIARITLPGSVCIEFYLHTFCIVDRS